MIKKIIVFLSILILIFGWINGDAIAISESKLEEVLNVFTTVSEENRKLGATILNEYLKDMENGVENLKNDMDDFLNENQTEKLNSMGYSLNDIKSELDILKNWNLDERNSLIAYIKSGDTNGIRELVNRAGNTEPLNPGNGGSDSQASRENSSSKDNKKDTVIEERLLDVFFKDIEGHENREAIIYLGQRGIINGKTPEKFDPNGELTRAEFVNLIYKVLDIEENTDVELEFEDVNIDSWYYGSVKACYDNKIINGTSNKTFSPNEKVSREAMVSIVMRILNNKGLTFNLEKVGKDIGMYKDGGTISDWAMQDMFYGVRYGIIKGRTDSTLRPRDFATRGEAAEIIKKLYDLLNLEDQKGEE